MKLRGVCKSGRPRSRRGADASLAEYARACAASESPSVLSIATASRFHKLDQVFCTREYGGGASLERIRARGAACIKAVASAMDRSFPAADGSYASFFAVVQGVWSLYAARLVPAEGEPAPGPRSRALLFGGCSPGVTALALVAAMVQHQPVDKMHDLFKARLSAVTTAMGLSKKYAERFALTADLAGGVPHFARLARLMSMRYASNDVFWSDLLECCMEPGVRPRPPAAPAAPPPARRLTRAAAQHERLVAFLDAAEGPAHNISEADGAGAYVSEVGTKASTFWDRIHIRENAVLFA